MKVESTTQWVANTVIFEGSDDVYLRLLGNAQGLEPIWYKLELGSFEWVQDSSDLDLAWSQRNGGI